jgi:hypothetical protein
MKTHCDEDLAGPPPHRTEQLSLPRTGPGWMNGQGCEVSPCDEGRPESRSARSARCFD